MEEQARIREAMEQEMAQREAEQMKKVQEELERIKKLEQERLEAEAKQAADREQDAATAQAIMEDARKQQEMLETRMKEDRKSQQDKIREKLKAKKARRAAELANQQEEAKQTLRDEVSSELRQVKANMYHDGELQNIQQQLAEHKEVSFDIVQDIVKRTVEKRHHEESMDLAAHQMRKQAGLLSTSVGAMLAEQRAKIEILPPEEQAAAEEQFRKEISQFEDSERNKLQIEGEQEAMELRSEHHNQVLDYIRDVSPEFTDRIQQEKEAWQMKAMLEGAKRTGDGNAQLKLERMLENLTNKKEAELEEEMEKMEQDIQEEERKEMARMSKHMSELSARKEHALHQMRKEHKEELAKCPANQQAQMQVEHAGKLQELSKALNDEESKQLRAMQEKAQQRADDRRRMRKMALEQKKEHEYKVKEEAMRMEQEKKMQQQVEMMAAKEKELAELQARLETDTSTKKSSKFDQLKSQAESVPERPRLQVEETTAASQEQAKAVAEAVTQPLMERMEALEKMLRQQAASPQAADRRAYVDMRDQAWGQAGGGLQVLEQEQLSSKQQELYPFAKNFVTTLQKNGPRAITNVVPAASLPNNDAGKNAFGNSYSYDARTGALHIRAERLENPGELMLVLAHANAHIRSGNMEDDQSPEFQREFYSSMSNLMATLGNDASVSSTDALQVPTALSAEDETARTTEHLLKEHTLLQDKHKEEEEIRRAESRKALERKRTELRKRSGHQIKEHAKTRLEGGEVKQTEQRLRAQRGALQKMFSSFDKDNDGSITQSEFREFVIQLGANLTEEQMGEAFTNMDLDHNQLIDFDEVFTWYVSG